MLIPQMSATPSREASGQYVALRSLGSESAFVAEGSLKVPPVYPPRTFLNKSVDAKPRRREARDIAFSRNLAAACSNFGLPSQYILEMTVANALWGEQTYPFDEGFVAMMKQHYAAGGVFPADFVNNAEAEAGKINAWVAEQTRGRIQAAVDPATLDALTRMILVNAIYFRGQWTEPFSEGATRPRDFMLSEGQTVRAEMMYDRKSSARYGAFSGDGTLFPTPTKVLASGEDKESRYPASDGHLMVELPYKGGEISMVLLAPQDPAGLAALEEELSSEALTRWIDQLAARSVRVYVPKFTLAETYQLSETLQRMGMVRAFKSPLQSGGADFRGMSALADPQLDLYLSRVAHKAVIEVNEKGTVAAAVTVIEPKSAAAPRREMIPFTPVFAADRPFLFLIRDQQTGTILFLGRVTDPR